MEFPRIRPDQIKYEVRTISGENIHAQQQKKPGGFARFLSGLGRIFGAIAAPLSFIFPPAAIGAAAAYGVGRLGDMMQYKAYQKMAGQQQGEAGPLMLPGIEQSAFDLTKEGALAQPVSAKDQQVLNVLSARNDLMLEGAQQMKGVGKHV